MTLRPDSDPAPICMGCGAVLMWLQHEKTLKPAPIEAQPVDTGNVVLLRAEPVGEGKAMLVPAPAAVANFYRILRKGEKYDGPRFRSHFATCKHAPHFRDVARARKDGYLGNTQKEGDK